MDAIKHMVTTVHGKCSRGVATIIASGLLIIFVIVTLIMNIILTHTGPIMVIYHPYCSLYDIQPRVFGELQMLGIINVIIITLAHIPLIRFYFGSQSKDQVALV